MQSVRMYTTPICGFCVAAKRLLRKKGLAFEEIDVARDPETRRWLVATTRQRTVPQIFIGDTPIGGYTELAALEKSGELDVMLAG